MVGALLIAIGTFVRVSPDLPRPHRRTFYQINPRTRDLFSLRTDVKRSQRGTKHPVSDARVSKELIDYVDAKGRKQPPTALPDTVTNVAACIEAAFPDGTVERYLEGRPADNTLIELLTRSVERQCRNDGLLIAFFGTALVIVGASLPN